MKTIKKNSRLFYSVILMFTVVFYLQSCSQSAQTEDTSSEEEATHEEAEAEDHEHDADTPEEGGEGSVSWVAPASIDDIFTKDFHMGAGSADDLNAEVQTDDSGDNVLVLNLSGSTAAFFFHTSFGNAGGEAAFKFQDYKGDLKFVYHFKDESNYEYVSINDNTMELGRVVEGNKKVLDSKSYQLAAAVWNTLRFSAAGEHFKGYLNDEMITHGHDEEMEPGFAGIMVNGTGTVLIKSISVVALEE